MFLRPLHEAFIASAVASHFRHELGNTLGAISASAFFLRRRLKRESVFNEDPRVESSLSLIDTRIKDAASKLGEELVLPSSKPPRDLVVSEIAERFITKLEVPAYASIVVTEPSPLRFHAREQELELALFCLLQNAVEAVSTKGGGEVRVHVGLGNVRYFEVDDDGLGIPPEIGDAATRSFVSSKPGRMGLGLTIVRQIADRFGALVELERSERGGTRAIVKMREA
jgi:signal transduction histidine kinase